MEPTPHHLPAPKSYYRPTRARHLREDACHLEARCLPWLGILAVLALLVAAPAAFLALGLTVIMFTDHAGWLGGTPLLGIALLVGAAVALFCCTLRVQAGIRDRRRAAAALVQEHATRHGGE